MRKIMDKIEVSIFEESFSSAGPFLSKCIVIYIPYKLAVCLP